MTRPLAAPAHPGVAYRPEIDGLRAVAVVPVILFFTPASARFAAASSVSISSS
ncbi:hypothetical protein ACFSTD_11415 [Novosphingobium colocasiae]